MMEYWSNGFKPNTPTLQYSITPFCVLRIDRLSAIDDQRMSRDERRFVGN
jgi:hypothetical protein